MTRTTGRSTEPAHRGAFLVGHGKIIGKEYRWRSKADHNSSNFVCCSAGRQHPKSADTESSGVGSYALEETGFLGRLFFNFKPHKEAIVGQRDKITPPTMGDNYTFWGVTLYSITVKRGPGVRGEVWLPVARWRTVASNAMRSPAASPRTTSSGQQS